MAERKAINKYYPPEYYDQLNDKNAKKGLNSFKGTHHLRDRAKNLSSKGELTIRFEMPYNVWCLGCNQHIGKGVRYNAKKRKIGSYFSTPIYEFKMRCLMCSNWMTIATNPKEGDFSFISGVKRKTESWSNDDGMNTTDTIEGPLDFSHKSMKAAEEALDPMNRLEHLKRDKSRATDAEEEVKRLYKLSHARYANDYQSSKLVRAKLRSHRKSDISKSKESPIWTPLLPATSSDTSAALSIAYKNEEGQRFARQRSLGIDPYSSRSKIHQSRTKNAISKKIAIRSSSIFEKPNPKSPKVQALLKVRGRGKGVGGSKPKSSLSDILNHSSKKRSKNVK